jgi:hypothetical protein
MSEPGSELYHPLMLNQLPNEATRKNILIPDGLSEEQALRARDHVKRHKESGRWTEKQVDAIVASENSPAGFCICDGAPGTGKTSLGIDVAAMAGEIGHYVFVVAPANDRADGMAKTLKTTNPDFRFVRAFAVAHEGRATRIHNTDVRNKQSTSQVDEAQDASLLAMLDSIYETKVDLRHQVREDGLQHAILEETKEDPETRMKLLMRFRESKGDDASFTGEPVEQWEYLASCLAEVRAGKFKWSDATTRSHFEQAMINCSRHKFLTYAGTVMTTGNSRSDILAQCMTKSGEEMKEMFDGYDTGLAGH